MLDAGGDHAGRDRVGFERKADIGTVPLIEQARTGNPQHHTRLPDRLATFTRKAPFD